MPAITFQYLATAGNYSTWTTENNYIRCTIIDTLGYPMTADIVIANSTGNTINSRESTYINYMEVRILDNNPIVGTARRVLFYGKIEESEPEYDATYGQILKIFARCNLQQLLKRFPTRDFNPPTNKSGMITSLISDARFSTTQIGTLDTTKLETSVDGYTQRTNYTGNRQPALKIISDLALSDSIDPNNATPRYAYDFYLDTEFSGPTASAGTPTPDFNYFLRGSRPNGVVSTLGLTLRRPNVGDVESANIRFMLPDYNFNNETRELVTRINLGYIDSTTDDGAARNLEAILITHGAVTISGGGSDFVVGDTITWAGGGSAIIQVVNTAGVRYLVIGSITGSTAFLTTISGVTITKGSFPNTTTATVRLTTDDPPGSLREVFSNDIEYRSYDYNLESLAAAREKAEAFLYQTGNTITRGEFFLGGLWPMATFTGTHTPLGASATVLTDSGADFDSRRIMPGDILENTTDNVSGVVTGRTATTLTVSAGGMSWDQTNAYRVRAMIRVGWEIRIENRPSVADADMLVTKIEYNEGPGVQKVRMEVMGTSRGRESRNYYEKNQADRVDKSLWESTGAIGGMPLGTLTWGSNIVFSALDRDTIQWGVGTIEISDGRTFSIDPAANTGNM